MCVFVSLIAVGLFAESGDDTDDDGKNLKLCVPNIFFFKL